MHTLHYVDPKMYYTNNIGNIKSACDLTAKYIKNIHDSYTIEANYFKKYKEFYSNSFIQCEKCKTYIDNLIFL